jgi:hypothetical protein
MSKRHPLDDAFQNKLRDYSMPVPSEMWQNIESEMSRKKYPVWLPWVMGTTALAILALVGYLLISSDADNRSRISDTPEPTAATNGMQVIDSEDNTIKLSDELSTVRSTKDGLERDHSVNAKANTAATANSNEVVLNTVDENQGNQLNKFSQPVKAESEQTSDRALFNNSKNSSIKEKRKAAIELANTVGSEPFARSSSGSSYDKKEDLAQVALKESGYAIGSDDGSGIERDTEAGTSALSDISTELTKSGLVRVPTSLNNNSPVYNVLSDDESMGLPKLRKIRDRNCEDEQFSPGNIFLEFSYSLHHGNFNFRPTEDIFNTYASLRSNGEQFNVSKQFQGLIAFQVGKRSYFKTGISLNVLQSDYYFVDQMNKRKIIDSIWNDKTMEYEVTERETDIYIDGVNRYIFVDIPLLFSYGWQFNKFGMNLTTGPMVNISFTREGRLPNLIGQGIDLQDGLWNDRDIYRKTAGLSWFLSTQISYQAYRNVDIYIEPRIISGLNSITLENDGAEMDQAKVSYPISQRIFQYGIGAGLRFSLNNK